MEFTNSLLDSAIFSCLFIFFSPSLFFLSFVLPLFRYLVLIKLQLRSLISTIFLTRFYFDYKFRRDKFKDFGMLFGLCCLFRDSVEQFEEGEETDSGREGNKIGAN